MKMPGGRSGILSLSIKDKAVLYSAYMPFITNGGLFIPTDKQYKLGEEIFLLLNIMDEPDKIPVAGKVVWITPKGAQGNRSAGIGVQFSDQDDTARVTLRLSPHAGHSCRPRVPPSADGLPPPPALFRHGGRPRHSRPWRPS